MKNENETLTVIGTEHVCVSSLCLWRRSERPGSSQTDSVCVFACVLGTGCVIMRCWRGSTLASCHSSPLTPCVCLKRSLGDGPRRRTAGGYTHRLISYDTSCNLLCPPCLLVTPVCQRGVGAVGASLSCCAITPAKKSGYKNLYFHNCPLREWMMEENRPDSGHVHLQHVIHQCN